MKVYLVWKRVDYSDYDVIGIFVSKEKAEQFKTVTEHNDEWGHTYWIEEKEVSE